MHPIEAAYRNYGHLVLRRARWLLGNESDAREITQEVFSQWWARPRLFAGRAKLSTWLYVVTTQACYAHIRKRRRRSRLMADRESELMPSPAAVDPEALEFARNALEQLSEEQATVLVFYHMDGMTQAEIAQCVGKSRRRVGQILSAAQAQLQHNEGEDPRHAQAEPGSDRILQPRTPRKKHNVGSS